MSSSTQQGRARRLLASAVLMASALAFAYPTAEPGVDVAETSSSAATLSGRADYEDFSLTVSQTRDLTDSSIDVTWSGLPANGDDPSQITSYVSLMQCWSDDPAGDAAGGGPKREQCYFGTYGDDGPAGRAGSRSVEIAGTYADKNETEPRLSESDTIALVPFDPVREGDLPIRSQDPSDNPFFSQSVTNEVPVARTRLSGTGKVLFDVLTGQDAAGLGCGFSLPSGPHAGKPRTCWLVAVPHAPDRSNAPDRPDALFSPLSASNWANRVVVPLQFRPIGASCPRATEQVSIYGTEQVGAAVLNWLPALCRGADTSFFFTRTNDNLLREQVARTSPGLVFSTDAQRIAATPASDVVVAPALTYGMTVAFFIEPFIARSYVRGDDVVETPLEEFRKNGERVESMKLNQRLLAKLLTQTYAGSVPAGDPNVDGNPVNLLGDKEFRALNPHFASQFIIDRSVFTSIIVPFGDANDYEAVWRWILADPSARAFLAGGVDEHGTRINRSYIGATLPKPDFARMDPFCLPLNRNDLAQLGTAALPFCANDTFRDASSLADAARKAARGDGSSYNPTLRFIANRGVFPGWSADDRQRAGNRYVLALTDTASARRFGLSTAALPNANGDYVTPTVASMQAAVDAAPDAAVPGVVTPDAAARVPGAYPLTSVAHAVLSPSKVTKARASQYASLLEYGSMPGQVPGTAPGQLMPGFAPLSAKLRGLSLAAAGTLRQRGGIPLAVATPTPAATATPAPTKVSTPAPSASPRPEVTSTLSRVVAGATTTAVTTVPASAPTTVATPTRSASPAPTPSATAVVTQNASETPVVTARRERSPDRPVTSSTGAGGSSAAGTASPTSTPRPTPRAQPSAASVADIAQQPISASTPADAVGPARFALVLALLLLLVAAGAGPLLMRFPRRTKA